MATKDDPEEHKSARQLGRRQFVKAAGMAGAGVALGYDSLPGGPSLPSKADGKPKGADTGEGEIPQRPLGRTGIKVSALGLGGHHLGDFKTVEEAIRVGQEAVDAGITFYDNCWEYWNGRAEDWLGLALKGRRNKVVLMTKVCTHGRGADLAMKMLEESLRRLPNDPLEVWQIHGVGFDNEPELAYAKGGVLEALDKAKKQGK